MSQNTINVIKDRHVKKVTSSKGRAIQMNTGAKAASGNIFLFLHADTYLPENAHQLIIQALHDKNTAAGAFNLGIRSRKTVFRIIEQMVYFRTRLTGIPYGDQGIFIKREFFETLGGYGNIPIMEDVDLMRRIKTTGKKIATIDEKVFTSARRWEKEGIIYCTLRNWILILLYLFGVPPEKLTTFYT